MAPRRFEFFQDAGKGRARVLFTEFIVYGFEFKDHIGALRKMEDVMRRLSVLPISISNREEVMTNLLGRPIFYREQPAKISDFDGMTGQVTIVACTESKKFEPAPWSEEEAVSKVTEDLLSTNIHWFRDE